MLYLLTLAASVAPATSAVPASHYREVMDCMILATTLSNAKGGLENKDAMFKNNQDAAREILKEFLPVIRFEGKKLGMTSSEVFAEYDAAARSHSQLFFNKKYKNDSELAASYNALVAQVKRCGLAPD